LFDKATLIFENGRNLVIYAKGNNKENVYIRKIILNDRNLSRNYIKHVELQKGGMLTFEMVNQPNIKRGLNTTSYPFSMSLDR
jgi:putative alpha-1,2-mannosidase